MKKDKTELYNNRILNFLLNRGVYSVSAIADHVGLSEKTVRIRLNEIDEWLRKYDYGIIQRQRGVGVRLVVDETARKKLETYLLSEKKYPLPVTQPNNRNRELISCLLNLKPGTCTTLQQLADNLYMSPPTVSSVLKETTYWFENRNLRIEALRSKGIYLSGDEYDIRIAVHDYIMETESDNLEDELKQFVPGIDITRIRGIIVDAENAWRIELADSSFKMIWILVCLSLSRKRLLEYEGKWLYQEQDVKNYNEYSFAESIYRRIEYVYKINALEIDIVFLAIMLLNAKKLNIASPSQQNTAQEYDRDLQGFVKLVIDTIGTVLDVNLLKDEVLYESLLQHMRSTIFRMKYSTVISESISNYVKKEYTQTYLATWSTSHLFEEYYDIQVTEDELAGIALYIQAAIIRQKKRKLIRALLVTERGLASSQLMVEMLKYSVPELSDIEVTGFHNFRPYSYPNMDVIINASEAELLDDREVKIGTNVNEAGIRAVRKKISQTTRMKNQKEFHFHALCHQLFAVDLLIIHPEISGKDELLKLMIKRLEEKGTVDSEFQTSVFERERATTTCIGHGIAIPHGNISYVNDPRIVVAILKDPIDWHDDQVDIVFLLAVKMTTDFEIKRTKQFYKDFLELTDNETNLTAMKEMRSSLELYQYLIK